MNSTDSCHLLFFIIVSPREGGDFSRDFTTILAPESRAFSGALKIEKLKAPLIPGHEGAVDTSDWFISHISRVQMSLRQMYSYLKMYFSLCIDPGAKLNQMQSGG